MQPKNLEFKLIKPAKSLSDFVDFFWLLENRSDEEQEVVVLPDGRIDIFFGLNAEEPYGVILMGLGTEPSHSKILAQSKVFAISFSLLAAEYLLDTKIGAFLNFVKELPNDFWGITEADLSDFEKFCGKATVKMQSLLKDNVDERKRKLLQLIYASDGGISVKELSDKVNWSSRQINRYFNDYFGLSLKAYCTILRFRASFPQIKEGKLFPEQNYTDQTHFIKEVKKFSGVVPKELSKNKDNRFIHFTTLPKK